MKFIFPNQHSIFLHDTPSRELFASDQRTFSSGYIRVAHPLDLAATLLGEGQDNWSAGAHSGEPSTIPRGEADGLPRDAAASPDRVLDRLGRHDGELRYAKDVLTTSSRRAASVGAFGDTRSGQSRLSVPKRGVSSPSSSRRDSRHTWCDVCHMFLGNFVGCVEETAY